MHRIKAALAATTILAGATAAAATDLEVTHWWTSGGEAAAVAVFADAFNNAGHNWVDGAIAGGGNARPIIISRISGGDPMGATQLNTGRDAEDLVWLLHGLGIDTGVNLDRLVQTSHWMAGQLGRPSPSRVVQALGKGG